MPEYSSTTITPADGVQVPSMNGSTSGNFLLSALKSYILAEKGQANGLASLGSDGKLTAAQLPDLADDVIVVASYAVLPAAGTAGKIYITADNNKLYRWDPDLTTPDYVELSVDLSAYATKAELAEEESAREAADSNLKSAIQGNSQRIENLEVAVSGSLVQTNTDATMANTKTITNANSILPWAILKRVGARAVAWNQLAPELTSANYQTGVATITDGVATGTRSSAGWIIGKDGFQWQAHVYIAMVKVKLTSNTTAVYLRCAGVNRVATQETTSWQTLVALFTPDPSGTGIAVNDTRTGSWDAVSVKEFQVFDLTTMNMASLTANQFRAKYPASYYPPNTGEIIPLNPSALKVVGKNKFANAISIISGGGYYSSGDMYLPKGSYILTFNNVSAYSIKYWLNGSNVSDTGTKSLGAGASAIFSFSMSESGIMSFGGRHDPADSNAQVSELTELMIRPSTTSATYEPCYETTIDTSFTEDYLYVNEDCHDYSENVLVNGVMRREEHLIVGSITYDGSSDENWVSGGQVSNFYIQLNTLMKASSYIGKILCDRLETVSSNFSQTSGAGIMSISGYSDSGSYPSQNWLYAKITESITTTSELKTWLAQNPITVNFALATPSTTTLHDPIPNIPCEDGTTITAVTPQTDLVNAIDVPSTIAYMTKIGG